MKGFLLLHLLAVAIILQCRIFYNALVTLCSKNYASQSINNAEVEKTALFNTHAPTDDTES